MVPVSIRERSMVTDRAHQERHVAPTRSRSRRGAAERRMRGDSSGIAGLLAGPRRPPRDSGNLRCPRPGGPVSMVSDAVPPRFRSLQMQASLPATRARHDAHHAPPMWRGAAVEAAWIRDDRRDHVIQQEGDRPKSRTGPAREDRARSRGGLGTDGSRKRILLAEDYANTRDVYRAILVYGGFDATTAEDGEEAVRLAREELPDLILMDINLPALSGWDAARMLKHGAATKD